MENFLVSGVTAAMLRALTALGVDWDLRRRRPCACRAAGWAGCARPRSALDCGNSATTLRLLAGAVAAAGIPAVLDGSPGLRRRPMERIVEPLRRMGVAIETAEGGGAPLRLAGARPGQKLRALDYTLPVASAQVKTCLLLAALAADGPTTLARAGPFARPHRAHAARHGRGGAVLRRRQDGGYAVDA